MPGGRAPESRRERSDQEGIAHQDPHEGGHVYRAPCISAARPDADQRSQPDDMQVPPAEVSTTTRSCQCRLSNDTHLYESRRHLPLRDSGPGTGSGPLYGEGLFEIAQTVAAPLDVEDVSAAQMPVENRGGEHLVTGEPLGDRRKRARCQRHPVRRRDRVRRLKPFIRVYRSLQYRPSAADRCQPLLGCCGAPRPSPPRGRHRRKQATTLKEQDQARCAKQDSGPWIRAEGWTMDRHIGSSRTERGHCVNPPSCALLPISQAPCFIDEYLV